MNTCDSSSSCSSSCCSSSSDSSSSSSSSSRLGEEGRGGLFREFGFEKEFEFYIANVSLVVHVYLKHTGVYYPG